MFTINTFSYIKTLTVACSMGLILSACTTSKVQDENTIKSSLDDATGFTPQSWATSADAAQLETARNVNWLDSFNDPLLSNLVRQALANNYELAAAAANVDRANAMAVQAGAQLKPQANLAFASSRSGSGSNDIPNVNSQSISAQVSWEADIWGRISAGQRAATASAEAAAADYQFAQYSLAAATAKAYFIAVEAGLQIDVLRNILTSLEETQRIVNVQYENGLASAQDVALTNSDLATTREQLITLEASQREALRALEVLLGRYPSGDIPVETSLPALPAMPPTGVPSDILERRPDVIAADRRVAAAFNALKQAKAARLPQLSLTGTLGGSSSELSNITDPANVAWQVAGNLLAPLFDGGLRQAQVDAANAEQRQAIAAYSQTALAAFNEVETNLDLANTLTRREQQIATAQSEAERAYRLSSLNYEEGEISLIDLLTVQQRVLQANSSYYNLQRLSLEQRVNLYLSLGGNWE